MILQEKQYILHLLMFMPEIMELKLRHRQLMQIRMQLL